MSQYWKVQGHEKLVRDMSTGAIINNNNAEKEKYLAKKRQVRESKNRVENLENRMNNLENKLDMIISLLSQDSHRE